MEDFDDDSCDCDVGDIDVVNDDADDVDNDVNDNGNLKFHMVGILQS